MVVVVLPHQAEKEQEQSDRVTTAVQVQTVGRIVVRAAAAVLVQPVVMQLLQLPEMAEQDRRVRFRVVAWQEVAVAAERLTTVQQHAVQVERAAAETV